MKLGRKRTSKVLLLMGNQNARTCLGIVAQVPQTFTGIVDRSGISKENVAYTLRQLKELKLIEKKVMLYKVSEFGLKVITLTAQIEVLYAEYDMNDIGKDGVLCLNN